MNKWLRLLLIILGSTVAVYGAYIALGTMTIRNQPSYILVHLAIYPRDISTEWKLVPFIDRLSIATLKDRNVEAIEADYGALEFTLYSGALGYSDVYSESQTRLEKMRAREVTEILFKKGVRAIGRVDSVGCSAVHQAILAADIEAAQYLLRLEGVGDAPGKADAKYEPCRRGVVELVKAREKESKGPASE